LIKMMAFLFYSFLFSLILFSIWFFSKWALQYLIVKTTTKQNNCIYVGNVFHTRKEPLLHSFSYNIFMMYTELNHNTPNSFEKYWFWSSNPKRKTLVNMNSECFLSLDSAKNMIRKELGDQIADCISKIFLLTHWSYFGFQFNPISIYYCYDASEDEQLIAVISEVHNTPWGEITWYCHPCTLNNSNNDSLVWEDYKKKNMHVSPFFGMQYHYRVAFSKPTQKLTMSWDLFTLGDDKKKEFNANMTLRKIPITQWTLIGALMAFPFMTIKVISAIYWQAFQLWWKVPFISHPQNL